MKILCLILGWALAAGAVCAFVAGATKHDKE